VLIKKKDVNEYFAARRGEHRLGRKQASVAAASESSNVKLATESSSPAVPINMPGTLAPTQFLAYPFFMRETGLIDRPTPVIKKRDKA
jgi:hypothetical protein